MNKTGNLEDKGFFYLAPMQGATDFIYRKSFSKFFRGVDLFMSPFIVAVENKKIKPAFIGELDIEKNRGIELVPQILGNDAAAMISVIKTLNAIGYKHVNWNLGCPYPMVAKKRRGAGLLPYPKEIARILEKVFSEINCEISVKMRLGYHDFQDEGKKVLETMNSFNLKEIVLHPRTGQQMYSGIVDLNSFEEAISISNHKIVYNGDIITVGNYNELKKRFKEIDSWMIGRGLLKNPFLIEEINSDKKTYLEKVKILEKFHHELYDEYSQSLKGPGHLLDRMKGQWFYLSDFFKEGKKYFKKLKKCSTVENYKLYVSEIFKQNMN